MSKQNGPAPKYILIASPTLAARNQKPDKKGSIRGKYERAIEQNTTAPFAEARPFPKQDRLKSESREAGKGLTSVRSELEGCMGALQEEMRRNRVLRELIEVVGCEMQRAEEAEKQLQEVRMEESLKRAQKTEYDIEQILQKHNEEVARINTLKEQVASARSDRVVFSNLFRKLQKEIKRNEEQYRSLIIRTEMNRQRKAQRQQQLDLQHAPSVDQLEPREQFPRSSDGKKEGRLTAECRQPSKECRFFLTIPQGGNSANKKASYRVPQQEGESSQRLKYLIECIETKVEKLAKSSECSSCQEAVQFYAGVGEENARLARLIAEEERRIEEVEAEMTRIREERRISEVFESRQLGKLENLASTRKIRSVRQIKTTITEESQRQDQNMELLGNIFEILGIAQGQSVQRLLASEEAMTALSSQIQAVSGGNFKKSSSSLSRSSGSEHDLQMLLGRMERFQNCDRILNRKQFCTEYVKQVSRNKRVPKTKK